MCLVFSGKGMTVSFGHLRRVVSHAGLSKAAEVHVGRFRVRAGALAPPGPRHDKQHNPAIWADRVSSRGF